MINTHLRQGDDEFERMRVFCTLRHFPELKTSLANAPKLTIPRALTRDQLIKATKTIPRIEPTTTKKKSLNKLCESALNDIIDPYQNVKENMRVQRDRYRYTQMSLQFQERLSNPNHPDHRAINSADHMGVKRDDPLCSSCQKLSLVGISFGPSGWMENCLEEGVLEREVASCGLLAVLGLPMYINNASISSSSPVSGTRPSSRGVGRDLSGEHTVASASCEHHTRLLSERLEIVLGVRLESEETRALHMALYSHLR